MVEPTLPASKVKAAVVADIAQGDWVCTDPQCGNVNFARRDTCNRCEKEKTECPKKLKLGQEIGKAAAEKSRGLFSADDWQCNKCGNVNWARRQSCNMCNAPKYGEVEERTGYGGGYNDRGVVEYIEREDSDGEYDEFGRRKKKRNASEVSGDEKPKDTFVGRSDDVEEEEDDEDDDEEDGDDGDLSKYDLSGWGDEEEKPKASSEQNSQQKEKDMKDREERKRARESHSRSRSRSHSRSRNHRSRSGSHGRRKEGSRSRSRSNSTSRSSGSSKRSGSSRSSSSSHSSSDRSRHSNQNRY